MPDTIGAIRYDVGVPFWAAIPVWAIFVGWLIYYAVKAWKER